MAYEDNAGTNRLARVLTQRMQQEGKTSLVLDFGKINSDFSLTTNTYPVNIPKGQYSVCRGASLKTDSGEGNILPENMRSVKPGDRVLVGWVFNEAVVIDIILSSRAL